MEVAFEVIQLFHKGKRVLPWMKGLNDAHGTVTTSVLNISLTYLIYLQDKHCKLHLEKRIQLCIKYNYAKNRQTREMDRDIAGKQTLKA